MERNELALIVKEVLHSLERQHSADLAPKWEGAGIFIVPKDSTLKDHEISMDKFMHKIVMMRDNMRVLEQQINASDSLSEGEKLKFQSYITKCYGSMTSFNFLFYNDEDKF